MDFTFDEEQIALRDVARQALADLVDGATLRELADDPTGVSDALWKQLVDLGWTGLLVPDAQGGAGASLLDTCIVLEQMGRVPLPGPFFSSAVLATLAARALGADDLLADLAAGSRRGTVALVELGHGDPVETVRARARRKGTGWTVSGIKPFVLDAHSADWMLVAARNEEGLHAYLVDGLGSGVSPTGAAAPRGVAIEAVPTLDPTRKAARVVLDEAPALPVGPGGDQGALWRRVADDVAIGLASELVGVADRALAESIAYTLGRVVMDQPLASYQVVRHKLVDMFHMLEMARVGAQYAAWTSDTDAADRAQAVAMATSYAAQTAVHVTGDNIQLHGAVGFTWGDDAHFLFKRAKQNEVLLGGAGLGRRRLARLLVEPA